MSDEQPALTDGPAKEQPTTPVSSSSAEASSTTVAARPKPRFPKVMLILTAIFVSVVWTCFAFASDLEDQFAVGKDVMMVVTLFASIAMLALWVGWFLVFSRWRWGMRILASVLLLAVPVVVVKVLRPVLGGDVTVQRWDPIWNSDPEPLPNVTSETAVDLTPESPGDYPRFLGPNQDASITSGIRIDADRFSEARIVWQQSIGEGWSGFVARNGYAVTMEQREGDECVTCYDITDGELQWIRRHPVRHRDKMNLGRIGPRSTPTIHDGDVYAMGALGNFVFLNGSDGTERWSVDLNELLGIEIGTDEDADGQIISFEANSKLSWGRAGSPLILGDMVVVPGGGPTEGPVFTLLAFDQDTGDLRWKAGNEMIAYGSPTLATVAGSEQILIVAETKAMGFDPQTGEKLWDFSRPGESNGAANTSQLTVVSENRVLTSKGYPDGGGEVIEISDDDGTLRPASIWNNPRALKTKMMSPLIFEGHAYSLSNGFLECARLSDGERIWKHRGHFGHGQMLLVGDQILLHSEDGELFLFRPSPDGYRELGSLPTIKGVCWNTLCLTGNKLLVRSEIEAACVELPLIDGQ